MTDPEPDTESVGQPSVTFSVTLRGNEYSDTNFTEYDISNLSEKQLDIADELLDIDRDDLLAFANGEKIPCSKCGTPISPGISDLTPDVCRSCRHEISEGTEAHDR